MSKSSHSFHYLLGKAVCLAPQCCVLVTVFRIHTERVWKYKACSKGRKATIILLQEDQKHYANWRWSFCMILQDLFCMHTEEDGCLCACTDVSIPALVHLTLGFVSSNFVPLLSWMEWALCYWYCVFGPCGSSLGAAQKVIYIIICHGIGSKVGHVLLLNQRFSQNHFTVPVVHELHFKTTFKNLFFVNVILKMELFCHWQHLDNITPCALFYLDALPAFVLNRGFPLCFYSPV